MEEMKKSKCCLFRASFLKTQASVILSKVEKNNDFIGRVINTCKLLIRVFLLF